MEVVTLNWNCPDHAGERNYVGVDARNVIGRKGGLPDSLILVVGEAPGPQEYQGGLPFIGPSGKLLRTFLRRAGLYDRCVFTNVCKHWPHDGRKTRPPTPEETRACQIHLEREIWKFRPRLALLVGDTAAKAFGVTEKSKPKRGKLFVMGDTACIAVYHPAYLLRSGRNPEIYRRAEDSIMDALALASWWLEHGAEPVPDYGAVVPTAGVVPPAAAIDTETTGKNLDSELLLVSSYDGGRAQVWHPDHPVVIPEETAFFNAPFDLAIMARHGSALPARVHDAQVLAWMQGEKDLSLKGRSRLDFGTPVMSYEEMMATPGWPAKLNYSAQDAVLTYREVCERLPRLSPAERKFYEEVFMPLMPVLARQSRHGFMVNRRGLVELLGVIWKRRARLLEIIQSYAWPGFNPGSPQQVSKLLFETLGLPKIKKTKTGGDSTDEDVLISLSGLHPVTSFLLGYRGADKIIGTYIKKLLRSGTAACAYHVTGTETGRLSTSGYDDVIDNAYLNLQNLPKKIKGYLMARPGYTFVMADYSQVELRIAACISGARSMIEDINNGVDLHKKLALRVWPEYTEETLPKNLRSRAKNGNFETLYGGGDERRAETLQVSVERAAVFNDLFPEWEPYAERTAARAVEDGYIETLYGRRRYLWDATSTSSYLRGKAGRQSINTPVQGTVADMVNKATVIVDPWAQQLGGHWQHQEHDCIMLEVPKERTQEAIEALTTAMDMVVPDVCRQVPITVDVTVSEVWK